MPVNSFSLSGTGALGCAPTQGASTLNRSTVDRRFSAGLQFRGKHTECLLGSDTGMCHLISFAPMAICQSIRSGIVRQARAFPGMICIRA
jgi:hypothetical protein